MDNVQNRQQEVWIVRLHRLLPVFLVALGTLWLNLGGPRLWDRDEPRNARCSVEMMERGDWIVPTFNDQLRTHKPILLYWLQIAAYKTLGVNEFTARLPSAAAATLTLLAIYLFARRFLGGLAARWAAVSLASLAMFVVAARAATPDSLLIATTSGGILLLAAAQLVSGPAAGRERLGLQITGYFALGMAVLAKGPVGLVLPLAIVLTWSAWRAFGERDQEPGEQTSHRVLAIVARLFRAALSSIKRNRVFAGLIIIGVIASPWYVAVGIATDGQWLRGFFFEHNLQRATAAMEGHSGGLWYYPLALVIGTAPWSLLLIPIVWWTGANLRNAKSPVVQLAVIWIGLTLALFSCAQTKLPSYITSCYPAVALLIGGFVADWQRGDFRLPRWLSLTAATVAVVVALGLGGGVIYAAGRTAISSLALLVIAVVPLLVFARWMFAAARDPRLADHAAIYFGAAATTLIVAFLGIAPEWVSQSRSDLQMLTAAGRHDETLRPESADRWLAIGTIEPSWVFYLEHPIAEIPIDAEANWLDAATDHLNDRDARLVCRSAEFESIQHKLAERAISAVPIIRTREFLKGDELILLRAEPAAIASKPAVIERH